MAWRAVRSSRVTDTAALALTASKSTSVAVVRNRLSPQCSCTSGAPGWRPCSMSWTTGSGSKSMSISAVRSSASARVGAMHRAIGSPTYRTLPEARTGCTDDLKPGKAVSARIGATPARSSAMKTRSRRSGGMRIASMRACASGLRRNAASCMPAKRMSPTYSPRPRMKRSSSLRRRRAPMPCWVPCEVTLLQVQSMKLFYV